MTMSRVPWFVGLAVAGLAFATATTARSADDKQEKGTVVTLDGLSSRTPADWKQEEPANKMRFAQFSLPKVKDDKADAELVIFKGLGGSAKDNIAAGRHNSCRRRIRRSTT